MFKVGSFHAIMVVHHYTIGDSMDAKLLDNYWAVMLLKNNAELFFEALEVAVNSTETSFDDAALAVIAPQILEYVNELEVPERL